MKILIVADYVAPELYREYKPGTFSDIDLILSCGDLPPEYLTFLTTALNTPLGFVRGNHDIRYVDKSPVGCKDLHGKITRFMGISILGLSGSHWYNGGPNQYTENQMRLMILKLKPSLWLRKKIDIVLTHSPPRNIHDAEDMCHRGFRCFVKLIEQYAPAYFIHGHIHTHFEKEEDRLTIHKNTKVINAYGYIILELPGEFPKK